MHTLAFDQGEPRCGVGNHEIAHVLTSKALIVSKVPEAAESFAGEPAVNEQLEVPISDGLVWLVEISPTNSGSAQERGVLQG